MSETKGSFTAASIRQEAQRLFAARGYAAVSMREIADAVGIRAGGLYNHFATKQDILRDLMTGHLGELLAAWDVTDPVNDTAEARLTAFARFHIRFHFEKPDAVFIAYMELRNLEPENFAAVEVLRRNYEGRLRAIFEAGAGKFCLEDSAVATRAMIAMLTGVTTWYKPGGRLSIDEVEEIYINMARRSVGLPALTKAPDEQGGTRHV
ncbi:TetR/AcrR family transcriptional regulator [Aureimonas fodinaquatilis]|uniref:TetR/AcrR family transcriptional regulator n=1 Tax=Aureimonas fodinaquatilis TaxID=2565783 RepID=A0A5B0DUZ6_9HYPH|nr:TetR/AcrR family transcriptional regulator [Aureimonas fodinaquatilis]KAA0969410.1 TetR/AcrR family transcriptional regulator [Aureimonas fodinaquatilis]